MSKLELLPAVDVEGGQAVRLVRGEAGTATSYGEPLDAALAWQGAGAEWVHLVDLDAAFGRGSNRELLASVVAALGGEGGAVRRHQGRRVAARGPGDRLHPGQPRHRRDGEPEWVAKAIAEHGDRIAVGLDCKLENGSWRLRGRGWTTDGGELFEAMARLDSEGCARYVITDVNKDGMLAGPNVELYREVCAATDRPIVASGGVSSLDDLRALRRWCRWGVEGAIVGKALYAGAFTLEQALEAVSR
jgi:1-(5-phosphoribosyl)-5-[(5-phosphoribosylamino)methylideneamino] imidazole-4-carboxamide isomerase/N-(5'phosphoribosyl)anthranilate isomerase